jgi:hypothetical protein
MGVVIDDVSVHKIVAWRREGQGVWRFLFVAEGYDEQFVMVSLVSSQRDSHLNSLG